MSEMHLERFSKVATVESVCYKCYMIVDFYFLFWYNKNYYKCADLYVL